jgi:hypothetical protein
METTVGTPEARLGKGSGNAEGVEPRLSRTGRRLHSAMLEVLSAMPSEAQRPQALARTLGLKKDVTSRLLRATAQRDPIAVMHQMPGPEALRRVLDAASARLEDTKVLDRAREAVEAWEMLIRSMAGDRGRFDTMLASWLPEAREKVDFLCRQTVYRGMMGIRGASGELKVSTAVLVPSRDGAHVDMMWIIGVLGLRRMRPGVRVRFATRHLNTPLGPEGEDLSEPGVAGPELELARFNPEPQGQVRVQRVGSALHFLLDEPAVGNDAAVNVMLHAFSRRCMNRYEPDPDQPRRRGPVAEIDLPLKALVFDALVHRDLYPGHEPELAVFDTSFLGLPSVNDEHRRGDRLEMSPGVQRLDGGREGIRLADHPTYPELVEKAVAGLGAPMEAFRMYRCRVEYPIYGTSMHLTFTSPPKPD